MTNDLTLMRQNLTQWLKMNPGDLTVPIDPHTLEGIFSELESLRQRVAELEGTAKAYNELHDRLMGTNWSSHSVLREVEAAMRGAP